VPLGDGALGFLPTAIRIPVNIQTNRNDFDRPIRKENPYGKFDVPRASMGRPDTLEIFKVVATGLNRIGGGDEYTPPPLTWFDHAPEDIEYLLGELAGGAGKFVVDLATSGQKLGGDAPMTLRDAPIVKRFVTSIDEQASQQAIYYNRTDALNRSLERVRDTFENEGYAEALELLESTPELRGAGFKRKKGGGVVESNGRPQIIAVDPQSVFGRYKVAEKAVRERSEAIRSAYSAAPASLLPNAATRERDRRIREENIARMEAQREFNAAWNRDVLPE
jgi:hypothetical protein